MHEEPANFPAIAFFYGGSEDDGGSGALRSVAAAGESKDVPPTT